MLKRLISSLLTRLLKTVLFLAIDFYESIEKKNLE